MKTELKNNRIFPLQFVSHFQTGLRSAGLFLITLCVAFYASVSDAKRSAPPRIEPVVHDNIKYSVPVFSASSHSQVSGYIEATDTLTNKVLWQLRIYDIKYDPGLPREDQEIYINLLFLEQGRLIVGNELGERFEVELGTRKVRRRSSQNSKGSLLVK